MPAAWAARALDLADRGAEPTVPRDAATVMLLRPAAKRERQARRERQAEGEGSTRTGNGAAGIEVYMLRRRQSMPFAPGASVFPGGSVDSRDADSQVAWAGPDAAEWGRWLGTTPDLARGLLCAAVRETFEESGVLLAGREGGTGRRAGNMALPAGRDLEPERLALLDRSLSLAGLLARQGLVLRSDLLKPWARWITPEAEVRRFDARFFAAVLPDGQQTTDIRDEADQSAWLPPAEVLAAAARGEVTLMPPTAVTLAELAACPDIGSVLAAPREIVPLRPRVILEGGEAWLVMPEGLEYPI